MYQSLNNHVLETIGVTPVIALRNVLSDDQACVYGKYEAGNPSFSLKDRIAVALIEKLETSGQIKSNSKIVVATSGNSGVSLALVCAVKGYELHLFMPRDASLEKRRMFESFGADLHLTSAEETMVGAQKAAKAFADADERAIFIDQFNDPVVVSAHENTTAQEILQDFPNGVDAFVMGVGTGGTISGVAKVLKSKFPKTLIVAVEPAACPVLSDDQLTTKSHSKIQQLGLGFIPKNLRRDLIDRVVTVTDSDAYLMTRRLSKKEGLLLGISSGANVSAALKIASELGAGKTVLTVFCDAGQRYFSLKNFFEKE